MQEELHSAPAPRNGAALLFPALACAILSIVMTRMGTLFAVVSMVPLGFAAAVYGARAAWIALGLAVLGTLGLTMSAVAALSPERGFWALVGLGVLQFAANGLGFTWLMAGNPPVPGRPLPYVRTLYRLLAVAALLAVLILRLFDGIDFYAIRAEVTDRVVSAHLGLADSAAAYPEGADAHPERIVAGLNRAFDLALTWIPRGIMLAALVFVMFLNRQLSFLVSRLFRKRRAGDLTGFFAPKRTVWVFAAALPVILLGRTLPAPFVEIVAWNVLVACALVFLAQGGGIVLFNLSRRSMPVPVRVILAVVFVVVMFISPVNLFVLGALLILGVAENWFPMRRAEPEAPA